MDLFGHTPADGAGDAQCTSHGQHGAHKNAQCRGPGLRPVRTAQVRRIQGDALAFVLDGGPISRRGLGRIVGVDERIIRGWCSGERLIDEERLRLKAPGVHKAWKARLEVVAGEEVAA